MNYEEICHVLWDCSNALDSSANMVGTENEIIKYIDKLQNNWNELKKYADEKLKSAEWLYKNNHIDKFEYVVRENELLWLKKRMQELEGVKNV